MPPRFLADENFNAKIIAGVLRREPSIDFQTANAAGILGLPDEEVLATAAREGRLLVSHDRETMPGHFHRFIAGSESAGLIIVSQNLAIREAIEEIVLVWAASVAEEWRGGIIFLPI
jgi:predicted nuclease of predicted toxin-antitoxin system